jgi:branched-subunit amino acid aminotransferase/4-amino-4-deoxychorismate lyase
MQSRFAQFDSGRLRLLVSHDGDRDTQDFGGWQALGEWSAYRASSEALQSGIDVVIASFAHPGLGFLGKSTSYHWSQAARREAQARGASEALLVRDGLVVEAATGTLAWCHRGRWFVHESEAALASVTLAALRRAGVVLESGTLPISIRGGVAMIEVDGLILLSALRLAVAIRRCEGQALPSASDTAAAWRDALLACHLNDIADNPL